MSTFLNRFTKATRQPTQDNSPSLPQRIIHTTIATITFYIALGSPQLPWEFKVVTIHKDFGDIATTTLFILSSLFIVFAFKGLPNQISVGGGTISFPDPRRDPSGSEIKQGNPMDYALYLLEGNKIEETVETISKLVGSIDPRLEDPLRRNLEDRLNQSTEQDDSPLETHDRIDDSHLRETMTKEGAESNYVIRTGDRGRPPVLDYFIKDKGIGILERAYASPSVVTSTIKAAKTIINKTDVKKVIIVPTLGGAEKYRSFLQHDPNAREIFVADSRVTLGQYLNK